MWIKRKLEENEKKPEIPVLTAGKKEISGFLLQLCESDPGADSGNPDDHFHAGDMFGGLG